MENTLTAKEYLKKLDEESGTIWTEDDDEICKAFIDFAKLHVEQALKTAYDNVEINDFDEHRQYSPSVNKDSILNAYPLTNIK